ncbi:hypothetical protein J6590_106248, partial [Homalodisca vitripennis]
NHGDLTLGNITRCSLHKLEPRPYESACVADWDLGSFRTALLTLRANFCECKGVVGLVELVEAIIDNFKRGKMSLESSWT